VAGWDIDRNMMIRPEPPGANASVEFSRFWDSKYVGPGKLFEVGNVVQVELGLPPKDFPFPHATEDRMFLVDQPHGRSGKLTLADVAAAVKAGISANLKASFGEQLVRKTNGKSFVPANAMTNSLDAIEVLPADIHFFEKIDGNKRKLRALIKQNGIEYDFSVPAEAAKARGADGLNSDAKNSSKVHVRLGLSRPMTGDPHSCATQINGVYCL
jgi:hypothetical protein